MSELKELLKPPFFRHVTDNSFVFVKDQESELLLAQSIRRLGEDGQRHIVDFAVEALNEKWERDFSEPLRWEKASNHPDEASGCPNCGMYVGIGKDDYRFWNHCPCCGQKLAPPEDGKE